MSNFLLSTSLLGQIGLIRSEVFFRKPFDTGDVTNKIVSTCLTSGQLCDEGVTDIRDAQVIATRRRTRRVTSVATSSEKVKTCF